MSLRVHYEILNQKGTPAFFSDTYANRPAFGFAGRVFISTDTGQIFEDTGSAWTLIADAGVGGGTLASVTANGNTTASGIVITAGNLGINTSSPGAPLDIHGTGTNAQFNGTGTNNAYLLFQNAGTGKWRIGNTYNAGANSFNIFNNGLATNAVSISSTTNETIFSGSVGIGSGTNPVFLLDVNGNTRVTGQLSAYASGSGNGLYVQGISNQYAARILGDATASNSYGLNIQAGTNSTDSPFTITNYAASSTFLKVNGTGNVLIASTTSAGSVLKLQVGDGTADTRSYFNPSSQYAFAVANSSSNAYYLGVLTSGSTSSFALHNAAAGVNPLIVAYNGNVLINSTTDSGYKLQVNGEISAKGTVCGINFQNRASSNYFAFYANTDIYIFNTNTSNIATIGATTGVYTPLSDINRKKDFEISTIGLNAILNLKPTLYRMKEEDNTEKHLGFIAQEVKQYIPQAYVESGNFIGLNYQAIVATLVKSIQELNEKLERNNIN
jgi:hypothetical protein